MPVVHGGSRLGLDTAWITSPAGRRIVMHWADPRPAWLWSQDGATLLWRNPAARYFGARIKKGALRFASDPVPIKGQIARLIRLGVPDRSSLSRVQFLAGGRPEAATCSCTPVTLANGERGMLLVSVDPIDSEVLAATGPLTADAATRAILPEGTQFELWRDGQQIDASGGGTGAEADGLPSHADAIRLPADSRGAELVVFSGTTPVATRIAEVRAEEGAGADDPELDLAQMPEPMLPLGLDPLPAPRPVAETGDNWVEPLPTTAERSLSSLFDRLADDAGLYTSLTAADERFAGTPMLPDVPEGLAEAHESETAMVPGVAPDAALLTEAPPPGDLPAPDTYADSALIAAVIEYADDPEHVPTPLSEHSGQWLITGRGFRALTPLTGEPAVATEDEVAVLPPATVDAAPDAETAERVSRYNFEELGRILTDRVAAEPAPVAEPAEPSRAAGIINLSAETLVLNRLPLAIMVFRDQQVLFANRALTDMLGHESVEALRAAGIGSIFPAEEVGAAGPVNRLIRSDGTPLPVAARLQSVSWQGRAALMLSASLAEAVTTHEAAVRTFAEIAAEAREEGYLQADRGGLLTRVSGHAAVLLGRPVEDVVGKPLTALLRPDQRDALRAFLEKPARFAETTRPSLVATGPDDETEVALFAEGQAGVVQGYFGFVRRKLRKPPAPEASEDAGTQSEMLGRLSRGIRRPLNTVIGFADLIRAGTPADAQLSRAAEYASDIRVAGLEIAVLVDELDDLTRLREGRYLLQRAAIELGALLDGCVQRVKGQAGAARVLVRSAVAEKLPRIEADQASLAQAVLNLLASAIDQTPIGGSVVLSAQSDDSGGIAIHVRDGAHTTVELADRFVVFRDGVDKDGEAMRPVRSSVGLAMTRSLLAVNACSLSVDPLAGTGTLFSMLIPAELVQRA